MVSGFRRYVIRIFVLPLVVFLAAATHLPDQQPTTYSVKPGDSLSKIATKFGNVIWWVDIYEANQEKINNPNLIFPGQELTIPSYVAFQNVLSLDLNRVMAMKKAVEESKEQAKNADKKARLKKFRKAFKKLVDQKENENKQKSRQSTYEGLGLGGMVLDETRSKMGSNFYSIFYNHWEAPEDAKSFTITISEQPIPSRGTMVMIELDDQTIYRSRLEPRYYKTEQDAKRAARICRQRLQRRMATQNELAGY